jgi:hypothetical protein
MAQVIASEDDTSMVRYPLVQRSRQSNLVGRAVTVDKDDGRIDFLLPHLPAKHFATGQTHRKVITVISFGPAHPQRPFPKW